MVGYNAQPHTHSLLFSILRLAYDTLIIGLFANRAYHYPAHTSTHTRPKGALLVLYLYVTPKLTVRLPMTFTKPRKRLHIIIPPFPSPVGYTRDDSQVTQHGTVQKSRVLHMYGI